MFPSLKKLSINNIFKHWPTSLVKHPKLEVIRLYSEEIAATKVKLLITNWWANCPKLKLLELRRNCGNTALFQSSGLTLMKQWKKANRLTAIQIDLFSEGSCSFDISWLPALPNCVTLVLAAKSFTNFWKILEILYKIPKLRRIYIYSFSTLDVEFIHRIKINVGHCYVGDLGDLNNDLHYGIPLF